MPVGISPTSIASRPCAGRSMDGPLSMAIDSRVRVIMRGTMLVKMSGGWKVSSRGSQRSGPAPHSAAYLACSRLRTVNVSSALASAPTAEQMVRLEHSALVGPWPSQAG